MINMKDNIAVFIIEDPETIKEMFNWAGMNKGIHFVAFTDMSKKNRIINAVDAISDEQI